MLLVSLCRLYTKYRKLAMTTGTNFRGFFSNPKWLQYQTWILVINKQSQWTSPAVISDFDNVQNMFHSVLFTISMWLTSVCLRNGLCDHSWHNQRLALDVVMEKSNQSEIIINRELCLFVKLHVLDINSELSVTRKTCAFHVSGISWILMNSHFWNTLEQQSIPFQPVEYTYLYSTGMEFVTCPNRECAMKFDEMPNKWMNGNVSMV